MHLFSCCLSSSRTPFLFNVPGIFHASPHAPRHIRPPLPPNQRPYKTPPLIIPFSTSLKFCASQALPAAVAGENISGNFSEVSFRILLSTVPIHCPSARFLFHLCQLSHVGSRAHLTRGGLFIHALGCTFTYTQEYLNILHRFFTAPSLTSGKHVATSSSWFCTSTVPDVHQACTGSEA